MNQLEFICDQHRRHLIALVTSAIVAGTWLAPSAEANIVAQWTFNNTNKNGEVVDTSGTTNAGEHNGKLCFGAKLVTIAGRNKAVVLDGERAYIDFGSHRDYNLVEAFSLEVWVLVQRRESRAETLIAGKSANVYGLSFYYNDGNTYCYVSGGGVETRVKYPLSYDAWHHIVTTFDPSGGLTLYVDGKLVGACKSNVPAPSSALPLRVGSPFGDAAPASPAAGYLRGQVDEFCLYDHALSADEVAANEKAGPTRK